MKSNRELFDIYIFPAKSSTNSRVDVAVGLKVSKKAVIRNRLREYVKSNDFSGKYIKVAAKPPIKDKPFSYIKEDLKDVLDKIK